MIHQPTLETRRLVLRPFTLEDASMVQQLAGDPAIADTTLNIPHPYPDGAAEQWIASQPFEASSVTWAIVLRDQARLVGAIGLHLDQRNQHAELGYWLGVPFWNQGYTTEAARAVLAYGFGTLDLHRIYARFFMRNPASGRVMEKLGMVYEGCQREHLRKGDRFEDAGLYGMLRREWDAAA